MIDDKKARKSRASLTKTKPTLYCGPGNVCKAVSNAACNFIANSHQKGTAACKAENTAADELTRRRNETLGQ